MFAAELAKIRYLTLPRVTAAAVMAAAVITGAALIVFTPKSPGSYLSIPSTSLDEVVVIAAMVFGVWVSALEFSAGTMQRTLTAEPSRPRVLSAKLGLVLLGSALLMAAAAATVGGLTHLAIIRSGIPVGAGQLARSVFSTIPDGIFGGAIGFGFGLLARSMAGGITLSLGFLLVLNGILSFIPGLKTIAYTTASSNLLSHLSGTGSTTQNSGLALVIMLAWTAVIVVPGWILFLRADLK
jgi:ABC-2 type transport system permease protein